MSEVDPAQQRGTSPAVCTISSKGPLFILRFMLLSGSELESAPLVVVGYPVYKRRSNCPRTDKI